MPREVPRARRIAEQAQRVLAQLLLREVRDPRLKPMTVTHVRLSPDMTHMWVLYTLLSGDSHDELQKEILQEAAVYLRGPLGRALKLRLAPQLHFAPDEELERGNRLDDLIGRAVRDDKARHVDDVVADAAPAAAGEDDDLAHYDSDLDDPRGDERA
jgi:ribosome-binding factor A